MTHSPHPGAPARPRSRSKTIILGMRSLTGLMSLVLTAGIALGVYYFYLKQAAPAPGQLATQAISTTGVEMDLTAIAQAERMYMAQNGSYADLDQLLSSGTMNLARTSRDGYTYTVDTSPAGFTVTARHEDVPAPSGVTPPHYPIISIDQTMQVQQSN
jgi:hypothetical protein